MGKLIVYCRAVPYKKHEISGDCCEMYSFNDGSAQDFITGHPRGTVQIYTPLYQGHLRWLDTVFQVQYLSSLSINYVAISKVLEKLPPQLY